MASGGYIEVTIVDKNDLNYLLRAADLESMIQHNFEVRPTFDDHKDFIGISSTLLFAAETYQEAVGYVTRYNASHPDRPLVMQTREQIYCNNSGMITYHYT